MISFDREHISRSNQRASRVSSGTTQTFSLLPLARSDPVQPSQASVPYRFCFGCDLGPRQRSIGSSTDRPLTRCHSTLIPLPKCPLIGRTRCAPSAAPVQATEEQKVPVRHSTLLTTHVGRYRTVLRIGHPVSRAPSLRAMRYAPTHAVHALHIMAIWLSGNRGLRPSCSGVQHPPTQETTGRTLRPVCCRASPAPVARKSPALCASELNTYPPLTLGGVPLVLAPAA